MRYTFATALAAAGLASAQSATQSWTPAPQVTTNPLGAGPFIAVLPEQQKYPVRGSFEATTANDGKGVHFKVSISGLPKEGGPFMYHIHEKPVPADGNCTGAGAHLDPYKRGEVPICDASKPETCQVGDLSGKFGNFTEDGAKDFVDLFSATDPSNVAYFGNLSVVVHFSNKTRISCANFSLAGAPISSSASYGTALPTPTGNSTIVVPSGTGHSTQTIVVPTSVHSPNPTQPSAPATNPTNAAEKLTVAGAGVLAGLVALVL